MPDFKISIKAPNKLKIPQKTIGTSFRDALKSGGKNQLLKKVHESISNINSIK